MSEASGQQCGKESMRPWRRGFWCLFATQFQGAFSDNVFKWLVLFLVIEGTVEGATKETVLEEKDKLAPIIGAVFALPFILFSMFAGMLADKHSKRTIAVGTKMAEVGIMSLALVGLAGKDGGVVPLLVAVVFLMSMQSAFFGPTKYGLLPEILPESRLSWGNGYLQMGTFVAIILGTLAAGWLSDRFGSDSWICGLILIALAGLGLSTSLGISKVSAANPLRKRARWCWPALRRRIGLIRRKDRPLFLAIGGDTYFWFLGALMQLTILFYGKEALELSASKISYLQGALAIGIGVGSLAAGYFSRGKIEYRFVPFGGLGMALCCFAMALPGANFWRVFCILISLGFFAGFFVVPLAAMIQRRPDAKEKGSVIAVCAVFVFSGVFFASVVYYGYRWIGLDYLGVFFVCGLTTLFVSGAALWMLPKSMLRFLRS